MLCFGRLPLIDLMITFYRVVSSAIERGMEILRNVGSAVHSQESGSSGIVLDRCVHSTHHLPVLRYDLFSTNFQPREASHEASILARHASFVLLGGIVPFLFIDLIMNL